MDITCHGCNSVFEITKTPSQNVRPCPVCNIELRLDERVETAKEQIIELPPTVPITKRPSFGAPVSQTNEKPPKTKMLLFWLWSYVVLYTIGALFAGYALSNVTHVQTGEKSGYTMGILFGLLIEAFAIAFAVLAIGLKKRKPWALNLGNGFLMIHILSPFIIFAFMGLKRLSHEDTLSAFGIDKVEE